MFFKKKPKPVTPAAKDSTRFPPLSDPPPSTLPEFRWKLYTRSGWSCQDKDFIVNLVAKLLMVPFDRWTLQSVWGDQIFNDHGFITMTKLPISFSTSTKSGSRINLEMTEEDRRTRVVALYVDDDLLFGHWEELGDDSWGGYEGIQYLFHNLMSRRDAAYKNTPEYKQRLSLIEQSKADADAEKIRLQEEKEERQKKILNDL